MQMKWFGDPRDVAKWFLLVSLALEHQANSIIQVACRWKIEKADVPRDKYLKEVESFFNEMKKLENIKELPHRLDLALKIEIFDISIPKGPFRKSHRFEYFHKLAAFLKNHDGPKVVLLDPDTGLKPKPTVKHVSKMDVFMTLEPLQKKDILVLYQHKPLRGNKNSWILEGKARFADALSVPTEDIRAWHRKDIANDVAFYYYVKHH